MHGIGLAFNAFTGNLRHSHVWMRFPESVERWLLSPAQHQVHHALEAEYHDANFGTWLACWDRALGTLKPAPAQPVTALGLSESNHDPHHLFSALIHPLAASAKHLRPRRVAAAGRMKLEDDRVLLGLENHRPYPHRATAPLEGPAHIHELRGERRVHRRKW